MSRLSRRRFLAGSAAATAGLFHAPHVQAQSDFMEPARHPHGLCALHLGGALLHRAGQGLLQEAQARRSCRPATSTGRCRCRSLIAGELDITGATMSAGLFNLMAKGSDLRLFFERGREAPGWGSNAILVSNQMWEKGFQNVDGYKYAKGAKIGISSRGSVAHYLHTVGPGARRAQVDDVDWQWGLTPQVSPAADEAEPHRHSQPAVAGRLCGAEQGHRQGRDLERRTRAGLRSGLLGGAARNSCASSIRPRCASRWRSCRPMPNTWMPRSRAIRKCSRSSPTTPA